ncbi:type II toxin-antitoxin system HipA family toxin [Herbiconiux moechotypicola]|uniref:HipA domain-containing protein n=1 Tax=Herbiconiux moechotypicola TaxID=637393 RepID=A0ABN3DF84_9MICO|nr:type II toxin-antitoxin system HipA family toxin [Herbiconiux moechotypicola]MCS5729221.1 type II toxin-antitoxin system HipA family toxin [Herbiconiux moechotypicola]
MSSVSVSVDHAGRTLSVGTAYLTTKRGVVSSSFAYGQSYLADPDGYSVEPALPLLAGTATQRLPGSGLPGCFADAAPDRWGRSLIARRLRASAIAAGRTPPAITERDYLLGVSDATRQGALRFSAEPGGEYLSPSSDVPRVIELPQLMRAAETVESGDPDDQSAIKTLLAAGTGSLGGARPKASVRDGDDLSIAKFEHSGDEWSVIGWEAVALDLAGRCGVTVPEHRLLSIDGRRVLLLRRFDRHGAERVGYISSMTLLSARDGESRDYLEIAESLATIGASVAIDLEQLWRRIAFSLAINNVDDHLRNHGLLRAPGGWALSPAFDLNPDPDPAAQRVTSIGGSTSLDAGTAALRRIAPSFGVSPQRATAILSEVAIGVGAWRSVASRHGLPEREITRFEPVFAAGLAALSTA